MFALGKVHHTYILIRTTQTLDGVYKEVEKGVLTHAVEIDLQKDTQDAIFIRDEIGDNLWASDGMDAGPQSKPFELPKRRGGIYENEAGSSD